MLAVHSKTLRPMKISENESENALNYHLGKMSKKGVKIYYQIFSFKSELLQFKFCFNNAMKRNCRKGSFERAVSSQAFMRDVYAWKRED